MHNDLLKLFHDINNKLTYIVCSSETLAKDLDLDKQDKEVLKNIERFAMSICEKIRDYQHLHKD